MSALRFVLFLGFLVQIYSVSSTTPAPPSTSTETATPTTTVPTTTSVPDDWFTTTPEETTTVLSPQKPCELDMELPYLQKRDSCWINDCHFIYTHDCCKNTLNNFLVHTTLFEECDRLFPDVTATFKCTEPWAMGDCYEADCEGGFISDFLEPIINAYCCQTEHSSQPGCSVYQTTPLDTIASEITTTDPTTWQTTTTTPTTTTTDNTLPPSPSTTPATTTPKIYFDTSPTSTIDRTIPPTSAVHADWFTTTPEASTTPASPSTSPEKAPPTTTVPTTTSVPDDWFTTTPEETTTVLSPQRTCEFDYDVAFLLKTDSCYISDCYFIYTYDCCKDILTNLIIHTTVFEECDRLFPDVAANVKCTGPVVLDLCYELPCEGGFISISITPILNAYCCQTEHSYMPECSIYKTISLDTISPEMNWFTSTPEVTTTDPTTWQTTTTPTTTTTDNTLPPSPTTTPATTTPKIYFDTFPTSTIEPTTPPTSAMCEGNGLIQEHYTPCWHLHCKNGEWATIPAKTLSCCRDWVIYDSSSETGTECLTLFPELRPTTVHDDWFTTTPEVTTADPTTWQTTTPTPPTTTTDNTLPPSPSTTPATTTPKVYFDTFPTSTIEPTTPPTSAICEGNGLIQEHYTPCWHLHCKNGEWATVPAKTLSCCRDWVIYDPSSETGTECLTLFPELRPTTVYDDWFTTTPEVTTPLITTPVSTYPVDWFTTTPVDTTTTPPTTTTPAFGFGPCTEDLQEGCTYRRCSGGFLGDLVYAVISAACCLPEPAVSWAYGVEGCQVLFPHVTSPTSTPTPTTLTISDIYAYFKANLTVAIDHEPSVSKLLFRCVMRKPYEPVYYTTIWYVDDTPVYTSQPLMWRTDAVEKVAVTTITEDILKANGVTKAGFNIQCAVKVQDTLDGDFVTSLKSDTKFVGAKIDGVTKHIMKEGESRRLYVYLTVPFGCGSLRTDQPCVFDVNVETLRPSGDCSPGVVTESSCGMEPIKANAWSERSYFTFTGKVTSTYGITSTKSHLTLRTPKKSALSSLWDNYEIGNVEITIVKNTSIVQHKYCYSTNDPYEQTFGGRWYELDVSGIYTMYKDENRNIEIQMETEECGWLGYCTCGLAVRAGRTVFEISICSNSGWNIGYTACADGTDILDIERYWNYYRLGLPTGNTVEVEVYHGIRAWLSVTLYPTVQDEGQNRGLCGVLGSKYEDDLIMRSGEATSNTEEFADSWRVDEAQSLFNRDYILTSLSSYKRMYDYCKCDGSDKAVTCSAKAATEICKKPPLLKKITPKDCNIAPRKKRMARTDTNRVKRESSPSGMWTNGWNLTAATDFCESKFSQSNTVEQLKDVPGVNVTRSLEECVEDIRRSGSTDFSGGAIANVRAAAMREAMVNPALSATNSTNSSVPSINDIVTMMTCLGDCSGRGACINGTCQCHPGYDGGDCSVDLSKAPIVYDIGDGDHCDLAQKSCVFMSVHGNIFSGRADSTCQIQKSTLLETGEATASAVTATFAVSESISEVTCTIPEPAADDVVNSYVISVSHSGNAYSNQLTVVVYDSTCVSLNSTTRVWSLENGYCIHKGRCTAAGVNRGDNPCLKCDISDGSQSWLQSTEGDCPNGVLSFSDNNSGSDSCVRSPQTLLLLWLMGMAFL